MDRIKEVFALFAFRVDGGVGKDRLTQWRPLLELCRLPDFAVSKLHIFHKPEHKHNVDVLAADITACCPSTGVTLLTGDASPEDFGEFYVSLYQFFSGYNFDLQRSTYYLYLPPGVYPHATLALMDIVRVLRLPLEIVQVYQYSDQHAPRNNYSIFSMDVSVVMAHQKELERQHLDDQQFLKSGIATSNSKFNALIARLEHVALHSRAPVLISGPTGAGKSHLVRRLYDLKRRHGQLSGPLVEVNCSTLRGDMASAALFGHARGAFTGAASKRAGLLLTARNGLLFLDEIGELGLEEQVLLLKAVEEHRFLPVGSDTEVESNFQLVCGTNCDLAVEVRAGRFRQDLLTRINLWQFALPALRDRREDIPPNVAYELERLTHIHGRAVRFSKAAYARFIDFAMSAEALWLGNFRELAATLERMTTFTLVGDIAVATVEEEITALRQSWEALDQGSQAIPQGKALLGCQPSALAAHNRPLQPLLQNDERLRLLLGDAVFEQLDLFERFHLAGTVRVCRESASLSEAGRVLFAVSRRHKRHHDDASRLYNYLKKYNLDWKTIQQ